MQKLGYGIWSFLYNCFTFYLIRNKVICNCYHPIKKSREKASFPFIAES